MFLNIMKVIIRICFYLILIGVCVTSWIKLQKELTLKFLISEQTVINNGIRSAAKGGVDRCPARAAAAVSAADPTFRPEYSRVPNITVGLNKSVGANFSWKLIKK